MSMFIDKAINIIIEPGKRFVYIGTMASIIPVNFA